jgi:hypothetical protein
MWFHKTFGQIFIQIIISVSEKNILLRYYFHLKYNKNNVGDLCIKILNENFKNYPQNNTKFTQEKNIFLPIAILFVMWFHPITRTFMVTYNFRNQKHV